MGRTYYFCRNERDFFKWCRRYVRRAQQYIESYESDKGELSRMLGEENTASLSKLYANIKCYCPPCQWSNRDFWRNT